MGAGEFEGSLIYMNTRRGYNSLLIGESEGESDWFWKDTIFIGHLFDIGVNVGMGRK